jgi:C4-dicarboxylate transporter DctM subunit
MTLDLLSHGLLSQPLLPVADAAGWINDTFGFLTFNGLVLLGFVLCMMALGVPLYVLLGGVSMYLLLSIVPDNPTDTPAMALLPLVENSRQLGDKTELLAIPFFVLAGAIMTAGDIAKRLIALARATFGWLPGGLAISGVMACIFFAAISGSSPVTVIAIGSIMYPVLRQEGYSEKFSSGLMTSSGSLGILIPPSIPMLVYVIVFGQTQKGGEWSVPMTQGCEPAYDVMLNDPVTTLFIAGVGPGVLIGSMLAGYSMLIGKLEGVRTTPFVWGRFKEALGEGFWALLLPILLMGGIYTGTFTVTQSAAVAVAYSFVVETLIHRGLRIKDVPKIFGESAVLMGSLLIIIAMALAFNSYLVSMEIPDKAVKLIADYNLDRTSFLIVLNILLLGVGALMDIMSAILILVPLLGPIGTELGIHPIHMAVIFIVNLEIGYLTPPVGLNLFVASTIFKQPVGRVITSVLPFIAVMLASLMLITFMPAISLGPLAVKKGQSPLFGFHGDTLTRAQCDALAGKALADASDRRTQLGEVRDASGQVIEITPEKREALGLKLSTIDEDADAPLPRRDTIIQQYPALGDDLFNALADLAVIIHLDEELIDAFIQADGPMTNLARRRAALGDASLKALLKLLTEADSDARQALFGKLPTLDDDALKAIIDAKQLPD